MKIVVLDGYTENPGDLSWDALAALGELTVHERTAPEDILPRILGAEAVYTNKTPLTRDTLAKAHDAGLRFVGVLATGYNVVDVEATRELGIALTNIPSYGTAAVAQFTFALLLELCHHVGLHAEAVRGGEWSAQRDFCFWKTPLVELSGKTMGLIGYGRIGQAVARIAVALGMKVLAYDAHADAALQAECEVRLADLSEVLENADVVSLHCPLTADNQGMMNAAAFAKMKRGALLINTARGPLVCEANLAEALSSGQLGGAAVDVVSKEPIEAGNPLLSAPNCLITPHIAWAAVESRQRLMDVAVENLRAFLQGKPQNLV